MGEIVARQFERVLLVAAGDQRKLGIALERAVDVAQFAIDARGDRRLGEAWADRGSHIGGRRTHFHFAHRSVGQADLEKFRHRLLPLLGAPMAQERACLKRRLAEFRDFGRKRPPPETGRQWIAMPRPTAPGCPEWR